MMSNKSRDFGVPERFYRFNGWLKAFKKNGAPSAEPDQMSLNTSGDASNETEKSKE
jgi:hypothetical protein